MKTLFVGAQGPKWNSKDHRLSLHAMLPQYRLLAKIVLDTLWLINRHIEMPLERAQFQYTLATWVVMDFPCHGIDVIHKAHIEKNKISHLEAL